MVTAERAGELWAERPRLFFEPLAGYGIRLHMIFVKKPDHRLRIVVTATL